MHGTIKIYEDFEKYKYLDIQSSNIDEYLKAYKSNGEGYYGICLDAHSGFEGENVDFLAEFKGVKRIIITQPIANLDGLMSQCELEFLQIDELKSKLDINNFLKLKEFRGYWSKNLVNLEQSSSIETLALWKYKPTTKDLSKLSSITKLRNLEINQSNIESLAGIETFGNLEILELSYLRNLTNISAIDNRLIRLQRIHFESCKKIESYEWVAKLPNLKTLNIEGCGEFNSLSFIKEMTRLEELFFANTVVIDGNITPVIEHVSLNKIYFTTKKHYTHKLAQVEAMLEKL
jgi:hypothetical protein